MVRGGFAVPKFVLFLLSLKVRQLHSGSVSRSSRFLTIYNMVLVIYILTYCNSHIQILFNDINHDKVAKQCTLKGTREHKQEFVVSHFSLHVHISLSLKKK